MCIALPGLLVVAPEVAPLPPPLLALEGLAQGLQLDGVAGVAEAGFSLERLAL